MLGQLNRYLKKENWIHILHNIRINTKWTEDLKRKHEVNMIPKKKMLLNSFINSTWENIFPAGTQNLKATKGKENRNYMKNFKNQNQNIIQH